MKLIIDIPEKDYNNIEPFLNGETIEGGFNLFKALEIIKNGTPLDNVTSRISELRDSWKTDGYEDEAEALNVALRDIAEEVRKHDRTDHI